MAKRSSAAGSGAPPPGQNAVRLAPGRASREAYPEPLPDVRAARPAMAGHGWQVPPGHVQPGASCRRPGGFRFHQHEFPGSHHPWQTLRALGVSLRADLLQLGVGDPLRVGVLRGLVRRLTERAVGTGGSAAPASQRQPERGGQQPLGQTRVPSPLSRALGTLRPGGRADQRPPATREWRLRVVARALQDCRGPSFAHAWWPGLRQSRRIPAVSPRISGHAQRDPASAARRGTRRTTAPPGAATG